MSIVLNGSTQYLSAASAVATAVPIAMSAWYKIDSGFTGTDVIIAALSGGNPRFEMSITGSDSKLAALTRGAGVAFPKSAITVTADTWQHGFAVFPTIISRTIWLNGGDSGTNSDSQTPAGINQTRIGATFANFFDGELAEVAIWAGSGVEAMGATEAGLLANGIRPIHLSPWIEELVLYQPLVSAVDETGFVGPAMTENGTPTYTTHPTLVYPPWRVRKGRQAA